MARAASREPSHDNQRRARRQLGYACARDNQRRMTAVHEPGLDQQRVVDAVGVEVGLADDGEIRMPGMARQQLREVVRRAALPDDLQGDAASARGCPRTFQQRGGLGLGVRHVLADDLGWEVPAGRPTQERLGDEAKRRDLRAKPISQGQSRLQAVRCRDRDPCRAKGA